MSFSPIRSFLYLCAVLAISAQHAANAQAPNTGTTPLHICFNGNELVIPEGFFDELSRAQATELRRRDFDEVYFDVQMPDLLQRSPANIQSWNTYHWHPLENFEWGRLALRSLERVRADRRPDVLRLRIKAHEYNRRALGGLKMTADKFGLKVLDPAEPTNHPNVFSETLYYRESKDKVDTVILCDEGLNRTHILKRCEHHIVLDELNAELTLSYDRRFLPTWHQLELRARSLFGTFIIGSHCAEGRQPGGDRPL